MKMLEWLADILLESVVSFPNTFSIQHARLMMNTILEIWKYIQRKSPKKHVYLAYHKKSLTNLELFHASTMVGSTLI